MRCVVHGRAPALCTRIGEEIFPAPILLKERKDENGMAKKQVVMTSGGVEVRHKPLGLRIWNNRGYYVMFLPVVIFMLIMNYWPMLGVRYAFYDYKPVGDKVYVGFDHFVKMFGTDRKSVV